MKIHLSNFEALFDDTILQRGKNYYARGHVHEVVALDAGVYSASVAGSDLYRVQITLDAGHNIVDAECNCPYDWSAHCKHQAAVLYWLRAQLGDGDGAIEKSPPLLKRVRDALQTQSKEAIIALLLELVRETPALGDRLLYVLLDGQDAGFTVETMWKAIRSMPQDRRGHHASAEETVEALLEDVLAAAEDAPSTGEAGALLMQALHACLEMSDRTQDYNIDWAFEAEVVMGRIETLAEDVSDGDVQEQEALFVAVFDGMNDLSSDFTDRLAAFLLPLCGQPSCRQRADAYLEKRLGELSGDSQAYEYTRLKELQFSLVERFDDEQTALRFVQDNLRHPAFREQVIKAAFDKQDYRAALDLALEGIEKDTAPELRLQWQAHAFEAYKALNDLPNARKLATLFLLDGHFECLQWLKQSYSDAQWVEARADLLDRIRRRNPTSAALVQLMVAEALWADLMALVEQSPYSIFMLHTHLSQRYPDRTSAVFEHAIDDMAARAADRPAYRELCARIELYGRICGKEKAAGLIAQLRATYPRKRALLDELSNAFPR